MSGIYQSIEELVGHTPLVELVQYEKKNNIEAKLIGKLEYLNPIGSVKDRIALAMIDEAEKSGKLKAGDTIVEITSGNTGIGLAAFAARKGYGVRIYVQDGVSIERTKVMEAYGAKVIGFSNVPIIHQTFEETGGDFVAVIHVLEKILEKEKNIFFVNQIQNPINPKTHYQTTGPEIWEDTNENVDILVGSVGTGGSLSGTGAYLKEKNPRLEIVAVQPDLLSVASKTNRTAKEITGIHRFTDVSEDLVPKNLNVALFSEVISVNALDAYEVTRELARTDGLLLGSSSGAAVYAAKIVANRLENKGKRIVVILPDTGLRYLSTDLY